MYYISATDNSIHGVIRGSDGVWKDSLAIKYPFAEEIKAFCLGEQVSYVLTAKNILLKVTSARCWILEPSYAPLYWVQRCPVTNRPRVQHLRPLLFPLLVLTLAHDNLVLRSHTPTPLHISPISTLHLIVPSRAREANGRTRRPSR